jgi:hypothetical protein
LTGFYPLARKTKRFNSYGSHGVSGIEEVLIGSNTEKVVRLSEVPVLGTQKRHNQIERSKLRFRIWFSKEIKPFKMIEFSKIFDAKLNLVMICTPNSFKPTALSEQIMNDFIADFKITNYSAHIYNDVNIEKRNH